MKTTILPAALAVSLLAGLTPAYATMHGANQEWLLRYFPPVPAAERPVMTQAALAQMALNAGITTEQASKLSLNELARLKEFHDS